MTMDIAEIALWIIGVDRRLITLRSFRKEMALYPSEIAKESNRSTQNISRALHELEENGIVISLGEKSSWKKYLLTNEGKKILVEVNKILKDDKKNVYDAAITKTENRKKHAKMKVFYGAAIQGAKNRKERAEVNEFLINTIKNQGFEIYTEHTTGKSYEEAIEKLEQSIGPIPKNRIERRVYVRNKMIDAIEGDIKALVFEVSIPSLGTGIEIAHAYLRPRLGLTTIPVLALYEKNYWPNKLSTMIKGISNENIPHFTLKEYKNLEDAEGIIEEFLKNIC